MVDMRVDLTVMVVRNCKIRPFHGFMETKYGTNGIYIYIYAHTHTHRTITYVIWHSRVTSGDNVWGYDGMWWDMCLKMGDGPQKLLFQYGTWSLTSGWNGVHFCQGKKKWSKTNLGFIWQLMQKHITKQSKQNCQGIQSTRMGISIKY